MNNISHYLYQYPRFRLPEKYKSLLIKDKKHFTSTLNTADINEAQHFAIFIKAKKHKELSQLEANLEKQYEPEN